MMHVVKIAQSVKRPRLALVLVAVAGLGLVGCNYDGGDPKVEIGANPQLPKLQQYLIPPIQIARVVGWGKETPTVPQGLQVHALATGFEHPRSLYVLPNGDVLVVETNGPKAPHPPPQGPGHCLGNVARRRQSQGRKPHHAAARHQGRRHSRCTNRLPGPPQFAVRRRAGRQ